MFRKLFIFLLLILSNSLFAQWNIQYNGSDLIHLSGIDFIDSLKGVSVGSNGTIIRTIDGG